MLCLYFIYYNHEEMCCRIKEISFHVSSWKPIKVLIFQLFVWWPELLFVPLPPVTYALNSLNYAWWLYDVVLWIVNSHNYTAHCLFIISKRMGNYVKLSLKRKAACNMTCHIVHAIQILCFFWELKVIWFKWNLTCMSCGIMIHLEDKLW